MVARLVSKRSNFHLRCRAVRRGAWLLALVGGIASAQVPGIASAQGSPSLALDSLPRPSVPRAEIGPVVPSQVLGWRQEALAYEHGDGVPRDAVRAAELYCRAARYGDAESQYNLAWMLTNSRGIERNDAHAAHLFAAAAEQGMVPAQNMLARLGLPMGSPPPCLRPPESDPAPPAEAKATAARVQAARQPAPPAGPSVQAPEVILNFVNLVAPEYKLSPQLVLAVMATESNFDPLAVSPKNAQGLMQLIPDTAARFNVRRISDPAQNIRGGMAYLRWLLAYFKGDLRLVLAGYNAGERAVDRYHGVPPYAETRLYVQRILAAIGGQRSHPFDPSVTPPSDVLALLREPAPLR